MGGIGPDPAFVLSELAIERGVVAVGTVARCGGSGANADAAGAPAGSAGGVGVMFATGEPMRRARDSSIESARFARMERTCVGLRIGRVIGGSGSDLVHLQTLHRHGFCRGLAKVRTFAVTPLQTIPH